MNDLNENQIWDYCEYCGRTVTGIFCGCTKSKTVGYHEETKREILNDLYQTLGTLDIKLSVGGKKWA